MLYLRANVSYTINRRVRHMPMVVAFFLISLFIWLGENIGTYTNTWLYPTQLDQWHIVGFQKVGSWLLLMVISFIMVDMLYFIRINFAKHQQLHGEASPNPLIAAATTNSPDV